MTRPLLFGVADVAGLLDLDKNAVYRLIRIGELDAVRIASREGVVPRKLRVPYASVEGYVQRLVDLERAGGEEGNP